MRGSGGTPSEEDSPLPPRVITIKETRINILPCAVNSFKVLRENNLERK